jgi:hypothetical protein
MRSTVLLPPRDGETGHRVSVTPGLKPVRTRDLPWPAKLAEYPCRILARYCARHPVKWEEYE